MFCYFLSPAMPSTLKTGCDHSLSLQFSAGKLGHLAVTHKQECIISLPVTPVTH